MEKWHCACAHWSGGRCRMLNATSTQWPWIEQQGELSEENGRQKHAQRVQRLCCMYCLHAHCNMGSRSIKDMKCCFCESLQLWLFNLQWKESPYPTTFRLTPLHQPPSWGTRGNLRDTKIQHVWLRLMHAYCSLIQSLQTILKQISTKF